MIVETLAICSIHLTKLPGVHALRHYGLSNRFEELLSALHNASSLHHYNLNNLKLVRLKSLTQRNTLIKAYQRLAMRRVRSKSDSLSHVMNEVNSTLYNYLHNSTCFIAFVIGRFSYHSITFHFSFW